MVRRGRWIGVLAVTMLSFALPASGADPSDVSGDVTPPRLESLSLTPTHADVTHDSATFAMSARLTDDLSGVEDHINVHWSVPGSSGYGTVLTRSSGDTMDGVYTGSITVPRYFRPGTYPISLSGQDRVGNWLSPRSDDLEAMGFPHEFHVSDANPDATAPTPTALSFDKSVVDVTAGPSTIRIDVSATDEQSGVKWLGFWLHAPDYTLGGTGATHPVRISGDAAAGTWSGTATIPQYAPQGRWRLSLDLADELTNSVRLDGDELAALGLPSAFDVISDEDSQAPHLAEFSMSPIEVNVHDQDQPVTFRIRLTDDKAGVGTTYAQNDVQITLTDPETQQANGTGYMPRTSGTAMDGVYEKTVIIPKSSATGLRPAHVYAADAVDNFRYMSADDIVAAGGVPALLVYNVPLPPLPIGGDPLDGGAVIRWDPPLDDRGAEIIEYVIEEATEGVVARVDGDARQVTVPDLANGIEHTFSITAVNKAGPSEPSAPVRVTPSDSSPPPTTTTTTTTVPSTTTTTVPPTTTTTVPPITTTTVPPTTTTTAPPPKTPPAPPAPKTGYWMVERSGVVHPFGDAHWMGNAPVGAGAAVDIEPMPAGGGYWVVDESGRVFPFGAAQWRGNAGALAAGERVTSMSATPSGGGYWLFTTRGRVLTFGNAPHLGDMSHVALNGPVLDSVPTPSGQGYYMVASDGGVFGFGDARFAGSMGGKPLNAPVQSLVPDPDGSGYWLVASDGGIFAFGAPFYGSMGSARLNRPVTGMVGSTTGGGYLMVGEDGGIFAFGDVAFRGSLGSTPPAVPVVAVAAAR